MSIRTALDTLLSDESGATLVEYGLLLTLIAVACITALTTIGAAIKSDFSKIGSDL